MVKLLDKFIYKLISNKFMYKLISNYILFRTKKILNYQLNKLFDPKYSNLKNAFDTTNNLGVKKISSILIAPNFNSLEYFLFRHLHRKDLEYSIETIKLLDKDSSQVDINDVKQKIPSLSELQYIATISKVLGTDPSSPNYHFSGYSYTFNIDTKTWSWQTN